MTEHREPLGIVATRAQIRNILRLGHERDINKGGLYDARSGCVNVWCAPEDKPACWNQTITQGALNYPREYVGDLDWEWLDEAGQRAELFVEATPYALLDERSGRRRRDLLPDQWRQVMHWLRAKAYQLVKDAAEQPDVLGLHCPFCDWVLPEGEMLNILVEHVADRHPERGIRGVIIGNGAWLDCESDRVPLVEATKARR